MALSPKQLAAIREKDKAQGVDHGMRLPSLTQKLVHNAPMAGVPSKHPTAPPIASPLLAQTMAHGMMPKRGMLPRV